MPTNGNCTTCKIEHLCGYEYKPCDCASHRKFKPLKNITEEEKNEVYCGDTKKY